MGSFFYFLKNNCNHTNLFIFIYYKKLKRNIYYCYIPVEPHQQSRYSFIFYILFSLFKLFFPLFSKKKKKNFFPLLVHTPTITLLLTFPFLFYLFISYYFTVILPSSLDRKSTRLNSSHRR